MTASLLQRLAAWPQYLLPQKLLTAAARSLSNCRWRWLNQPFMRLFVRLFRVDLSEAENPRLADYGCFDEFFTRALKPGARPLPEDAAAIASPSDGTISELGPLQGQQLLQAKGRYYRAAELLGSEARAAEFEGGQFLTIYLAPRDYHRVHAPLAGTVVEETRLPGRLFSVSHATTQVIPRLFARNERMCAILDTQHGPMAVVMVAALLVAGTETVWGGPQDLRPGRQPRQRTLAHPLERGEELGRFHWGSTVILLTPPGFPAWSSELAAGQSVRMGQALSQ